MISKLDGWMANKYHILPEQLNRQYIEQQQLQQLNDLLAWCKTNSQYYKDYPAQLQSLSAVQQLPFLTAEQLSAFGNALLCVSQSEISRVITMETSGTSGLSKRLYFSEADQQLTVDFFACGLSELNTAGDRCMVWMPGNRPGGMSHLIQQALHKIGAIPVPCANQASFFETAQLLSQQQVTTMVGSPVQILSLARYMQHYGFPSQVKAVLVSSDYLPQTVRRQIEALWHCQVFNHYGITEGGLGFSIECAQHHGLHIRENDLLVEIIDPDTGEPVPDGVWGELVFTTLTRKAMPLIRYRTGDQARLLAEPCACGSVVKRMDNVKGRFSQLKAPYCMSVFDEIFFQVPQIMDYRVQYDACRHQLKLHLLLTAALPEAEIQALLQPLLQAEDTLVLQELVLEEAQKETIRSLYIGKRRILEKQP